MKPAFSCNDGPARAGFTRADLVAALAVAALLAVVTKPVWAGFNGARILGCRDNLRRLQSAWLMYAHDNEGRLIGSYSDASGTPSERHLANPAWVSGWLDWETSPANTNVLLLTTPRYAPLWPYLQPDPAVYKCPADEYVSPIQVRWGWTSRVRSYSANAFMGKSAGYVPYEKGRRLYHRLGDFARKPPAELYVFLEEHPDSIFGGGFVPPDSTRNKWVGIPSSLHAGSANFSFVDGHVEQRVWENPAIVQPVMYLYNVNQPGTLEDPDFRWVWERTSEPE